MQARLVIEQITQVRGADEKVVQENIAFRAVNSGDGPIGKEQANNSYATATPSADLQMTIDNPVLFGQYKEGDVFNVGFTKIGNINKISEG